MERFQGIIELKRSPLKRLALDVIVADVFDDLLLRAARVAEGGAARQDARFGSRHAAQRRAPEKAVVFDALLPKVFALVAPVEMELDHVLVVALRWGESDASNVPIGNMKKK